MLTTGKPEHTQTVSSCKLGEILFLVSPTLLRHSTVPAVNAYPEAAEKHTLVTPIHSFTFGNVSYMV